MRLMSLVAALVLMPISASAYVGPGAGLGAIAVTIALILGVVLLFIGFLWYPLRRVLRKRKSSSDAGSEDPG